MVSKKELSCAQCNKKGAVMYQRCEIKLPMCKNLKCLDKGQRGYYEKV